MHGVEERVVDPLTHTVRIWQRSDHGWNESGRGDLLGLTAEDVIGQVDWPRG